MAQADAPLTHCGSSYFYAIARNMVAAGTAVSVIDSVNGKANLGDGVTWRPFQPAIYHELAMILNRGQPLGIAAARFRKRVQTELARFSTA